MVERACESCGGTFSARPDHVAVGHARWCSRACYASGKRRPVELACVICGKPIVVPPSKAGRKYCSPSCRFEGQRTVPARACEMCGAAFTPATSGDDQRTCSPKCGALLRQRREVRACAMCGKTREVRASALAAGRGKYCSRRCYELGKRRRVELICVHCHKPFAVERSRAIGRKSCTWSCRYGGKLGPIGVDCKVCGKHFEVSRARAASGVVACGRACLTVWRRRHRPRRSCRQCRRMFYPGGGRVTAGGGLYCSRACVYLARAPRRFACRVCKTTIMAPAWRHRLYCSLRCTNRGRDCHRDPVLVARDARILELRSQGLKTPTIQRRLGDENPEWHTSAASVRQVISRAG